MKKIVFACAAFVMSLSVFAKDITALIPLKAGVKEYTVVEYSINTRFGEYYKTPSSKVVHKIDAGGNDVENTQYSGRGVPEITIKSSFDSLGNPLVSEGFTPSGELIYKTEYVYSKGRKTEINDYDVNGDLKNKTIFKYEEDQLIDESGYDSKGALLWKTIYEYDLENRVTRVFEYYSNGSLDCDKKITYREDGRPESSFIHDSLEGDTQKVFRYNADNLMTEITMYTASDSDSKVYERVILKYDDDGNVIKVSDYAVSEKFGGTVNELVYMADYTYSF